MQSKKNETLKLINLVFDEAKLEIIEVIFHGSNRFLELSYELDVVIIYGGNLNHSYNLREKLIPGILKLGYIIDPIFIPQEALNTSAFKNSFMRVVLEDTGVFEYNTVDLGKTNSIQRENAYCFKVKDLIKREESLDLKNFTLLLVYTFLYTNNYKLPSKFGKSRLYGYFCSLEPESESKLIYEDIKSLICLKKSAVTLKLIKSPPPLGSSKIRRLWHYYELSKNNLIDLIGFVE